MAIDPKVIERDAQSNILDWPATMRFGGRTITCALHATSDLETVLEGGLSDDMEIILLCVWSDFGGAVPENHRRVELKLRDGSWLEFEIKRRPDIFDPINPTFQLILGPP